MWGCVWESKLDGHFLPLVQLLKSLWKPCFYTEGHHSEGVKVGCPSEVPVFASSGPFGSNTSTPDQMISELQQKVCRLRVYCHLISCLIKAEFTRVPRCNIHALGGCCEVLDIKEHFQSSCSIPTEQTLQFGSRGASRCALLEAALPARVIYHLPAVLNFIWIEMKKKRCSPPDLS